LSDVEAPIFSLDNRLIDGGEAVSLTRQSPFTPRKIPGTQFCYRLTRPQALVRLEGLGQLNNTITSSRMEPATFRLVAYCLNYTTACTASVNKGTFGV
jgi:hypothetical protein